MVSIGIYLASFVVSAITSSPVLLHFNVRICGWLRYAKCMELFFIFFFFFVDKSSQSWKSAFQWFRRRRVTRNKFLWSKWQMNPYLLRFFRFVFATSRIEQGWMPWLLVMRPIVLHWTACWFFFCKCIRNRSKDKCRKSGSVVWRLWRMKDARHLYAIDSLRSVY